MANGPLAGTLGEMLAANRARRFVGRAPELALFRAALASEAPPWSVIFLHGPGGIGKTRLLEVFAALAERAGMKPVRLDGHDAHTTPASIRVALEAWLEQPDNRAPGPVVLFDNYERLASLDDWVRVELLPRLPATAVTVLAGREPPVASWLVDPAWRGLLRVVALRNLDPDESRQYLRLCGVDAALHDRLVDVSHGHPLGLSLLADVVSRGGATVDDPLTPDLVGALIRQFIDLLPSALHRRALEVAALARVTTEALLRDAMDVDNADELFDWLRGLSFIESGSDGLHPHDLARDALDADLRWRDPDAYERVFRGIRAHVWDRVNATSGREQLRAIFDQKFMFRHQPVVRDQFDWENWGQQLPEPANAADLPGIVELVRTLQGNEAAGIARGWLDAQPEAFWVLRTGDGQVRGVLGLLDLSTASEHRIAADPVARAAWQFAHRDDPPRSGEKITMWRFILDRDAYQRRSPTWNAASVLAVRHVISTPGLSWYLIAVAEPEHFADYFAFVGHPRAGGADVELGGQRYGFYHVDWRKFPIEAWQDAVAERALAREPTRGVPTAPPEPALVLSESEFKNAVRQALRDLCRPDLLERNPLQRSRLAANVSADGEPSAVALADLMGKAVQSLAEHPRDDKLLRAVDRTYVRPAATQESAAAALGLPFSTYRRHLTLGVERITSWLWQRELHGVASTEQD